MKIRTTRYIIKEGFVNTYRNKLMSLASIIIVVASLFVFGVFLLFTLILGQNIEGLEDQPELRAFCSHELDDTQVDQIEEAIKGNDKIEKYTRVSRQEAFNKVKKMLENNTSVLEGMDDSFLPVSFNIKLKDPKESKALVDELKGITGMTKVAYPQQFIDSILKLTSWIRIICIILITILLIVAMFIISNTIKLTVFARRKEISIMKYIGATDWFIRWPFIIEGVIIGFIGAIIAFVLVSYGYGAIEVKINNDLAYSGISFIKLINLKDIGLAVIGLNILIGSSVGAIGSVISIRKYLHV